MCCILFIHLPVEGHLACFYLLVIINNSAMNMSIQVSSLGYIPKSGIAGFYGNFTFNFFEESPYHFSQQLYHLTFLSAMHNILISLHPLQ